MRSATTNFLSFTQFSMPRIQRAGMPQALANKENQSDSPTMFGLASGAEPVTPEVFKRPLKVVQPATADVSAADDLPTMESLVTWSNPPASLCALLTGEAVLLCAHYMFTLGDASFLSGEARSPRFVCCHRCVAACKRYAGFCAAVVCSETPVFLRRLCSCFIQRLFMKHNQVGRIRLLLLVFCNNTCVLGSPRRCAQHAVRMRMHIFC